MVLTMQATNPSNEESKMFKACARGDLDVLKELLLAETNVNAQNKFERTPLSISCWYKYTEVAKTLLDHKASINLVDKAGNSPLHLAFSNVGTVHDTTSLVELLTKEGANVNSKTKNLETPSHLAAKVGAVQSLKLLVAAGADLFALDKEGRNLLEVAKIHHENEVVQFLMNEDLAKRLPSNKRDAASGLTIDVSGVEVDTPDDLLSPDIQSEIRGNEETEEEEEQEERGPMSPMSPDLISEISTSNALQQYALFQEIVDEQFNGSMTEEDGLLLAELVEMGLNPNDLDDEKEEESDEPTSSVPPTPQEIRQFRLTEQNENLRLRQENDSLKETIEQYQQLLEDLQQKSL